MPKFTILSILLLFFHSSRVTGQDSVNSDDYQTCGLTSLYVMSQYLGAEASWGDCKNKLGPPRPDGSHSFTDLTRAAGELGLRAHGLHLTRQELAGAPLPAIIQTNSGFGVAEPHFLVILRCTPEGVHLLDAPYPPFFLPWSAFDQIWTGNILLVGKLTNSTRIDEFASNIQYNTWYFRALATVAICFFALLIIVIWRFLAGKQLVARIRPYASRRGYLCAVVLLAVGLLAAMYTVISNSNSVEPALVVNQSIDLGEFSPGVHVAEVTLSNPGTRPLHISHVSSNCSCASVRYPAEIQPGQTERCFVDINVKPGSGSVILEFTTDASHGSKSTYLSWWGKAKPFLYPANICPDDQAVSTNYVKLVKLVFPSSRRDALPVVDKIECDSNQVKVTQTTSLPIDKSTGATDDPSDTKGSLQFLVEITGHSQPAIIQTECRFHVRFGESVSVLSLPIYINYKASAQASLDRILFTALASSDLIGQERQFDILGVNAFSQLKTLNCPSWIALRPLSQRADRVQYIVKIIGAPPSLDSDSILTLETNASPARPVSVRIATFVPE